VHTPPIDTLSARTAGGSAMSPLGAPPQAQSAPSAPSTTPVLRTDALTPPALGVAPLRLLLAVALPHHRGASTAAVPTLRLTGIVSPVRLRPPSCIPPLPKRLFPRRPLATKWTRPPTIMTSHPPLHQPALSSRRSRCLLQEPEGQRFFRPHQGPAKATGRSLPRSPLAPHP